MGKNNETCEGNLELKEDEARIRRTMFGKLFGSRDKPTVLSEEEFLKLYSGYYGESVDSIKQIITTSFSGEELLEFLNYIIKEKKG